MRPNGSIRTISDEEVLSIKGATDVCLRLGGGVTSMAMLTRVTGSVLTRYADVAGLDNAERVIPVDVAVEADRRAKSPVIIGAAARALGYRLEPLEAVPRPDVVTQAHAEKLMDEATDLWRAWRSASADDHIDALEKREITMLLRRVIRAAEHILSHVSED